MKGLELCRKYYEAFGIPMIKEKFSDIEEKLCFGLAGSGSECFGYDDIVSADHDFEPGFCIFVPDDLDEKTLFSLERAYSKLPKEFLGYNRSLTAPVGGQRRGVIKIGDFFRSKTGKPDGDLALNDWFSVPEFYLAEATNGEIFADNYGKFSSIRKKLNDPPSDVFKKKLAGNLLLMKQSGQYNYNRMLYHGERAGAQLAVIEFVKAAVNAVFLLNHRYQPFYKWVFRALGELPLFSDMAMTFEFLLTSDNEQKTSATKYALMEDIAKDIAEYLIANKMTKATCADLEKHAYSVNDSIENVSVRNSNILYAV